MSSLSPPKQQAKQQVKQQVKQQPKQPPQQQQPQQQQPQQQQPQQQHDPFCKINDDNSSDFNNITTSDRLNNINMTNLSYTGIMIVLGITKDFFHPLLDEKGFYTLDGEHRLFTMPFEGSCITNLETLNISLDAHENAYHNHGSCKNNNDEKEDKGKIQTTRRYMWQLSYKLSSLEEATRLSKGGPKMLLEDVLKRTKGWYNPVQDMIKSAPLETIWGTPLMDRSPNMIHDKIMKERHDPGNGKILRTIVMGDN